jgi:hypothetical protein
VTTIVGPPRPIQPGIPVPSIEPKLWEAVRPDRNDLNEADVVKELRTRFVEFETYNSEFQQKSRYELDFLAGNHWIDEQSPGDAAQQMRKIGRSAFTIDLLGPALDLVVNQIRINKTTANFVPIAEGADDATAEVRQGLYRNIERVSKAAIARETGYQFAVAVGRGYWRVVIEDEDGATFNKRIGIRRVDNLNSIAIDPTALDFTYSDARWAYAYDDLPKDQFRAEYEVKDDPAALDVNGTVLPDAQRDLWFPKGEKVRVGEYFRKVWKRREVWLLRDGRSVWKEDAIKEAAKLQVAPGMLLAEVPEGEYNQKSKMDYVIEWRRMTGTQVLEKRLWPGRHIPIVVCVGREVFRGIKPKLHSGMVRPAIDLQKGQNYMYSRMMDAVALSPLPHMIAEENQFSPEQEALVANINSKPWAVIRYKGIDALGQKLDKPTWESPSPDIEAIVQAEASSKDNLQRVLNTYSPQLGRPQGDQSGRAIREVKDAGDISHAAFPDNFNRALDREAEIVNDLMDYVYTDAQAITITEPDQKTRQVFINKQYQDQKTGVTKIHQFGSGKYGVAITMGQAYPTRMAESAARLLELAKVLPIPIAQALDLLVQDLNIPNWKKYAERFRPPGFKDEDDGPTVPQLTQHLQEMEQNAQQADALIQKLLQKVAELGDVNSLKRLDIASKERIAAAGDRTTLLAAEMKAGHESGMAALNARLEWILTKLEADNTAATPDPSATSATGDTGDTTGAPAAPVPPPAPPPDPTGLVPPPAPPNGAPPAGPGPGQ